MKKYLFSLAVICSVAFGGSWLFIKTGSTPPPAGTLVSDIDPTLGVTITGGGVSAVANQQTWGAASQSSASLRPAITQFGDNAADIFLFDGVDDVLTMTVPYDTPQFLVAFFIVPDSQALAQAVGGPVAASNPELQWGLVGATRFSIILNNGSVSVQGSAGQAITSGTPAVMAMNYDGTTLRALKGIGGSSSAGNAAVANVKLGNGNTFYIGGLPGKTSFSGMIGNIRVWYGVTGSLSATEMGAFYVDMQDRYGF